MATILIVDDLATNREVLTTVLRHHRHRPLEAEDGRQALALARLERPDLIITDVLMPVMDGYEFVRQLRLDDGTRATPVVFYTAHYGEPEDRALARAAGVKWILAKPADSHALMDVVDRVLAGQTEPGMATDDQAPSVAAAFDREHRRLLTDKLSVKTADLLAANTRLRMLVQIGLDLASERNAAPLLQRVCVAAGDLFGAADVTLGLVEPGDPSTVQCVVVRGLEPPSWVAQGDALPAPLSAVVADRQTVRGFSAVFGPAAPSYLAAPVASPDAVYGWLCLVGPPGRLFSDEEELLITALAGQAGRIYENIVR